MYYIVLRVARMGLLHLTETYKNSAAFIPANVVCGAITLCLSFWFHAFFVSFLLSALLYLG